jgi:signal transduction histidine kinase
MDIPTLYLTASLMLISLPIALWSVVGPKQRRQPVVMFWCAGGVVFGLGVGLIGFRSLVPGPVTISLAFGLVDFGLLLRWQAMRGLLNRPPVSWLSLIGLASACLLLIEWARSTGVIAWPLIAYPIQLAIAGVLIRECTRIIREQRGHAARWLMFSYMLPSISVAIQMLIFLTSLEIPIATYPAQTTPITGVTMVFMAVVSNFALLGILSERRAREEAAEIKRVERQEVLREFSARLSRADRMRSLGALAGALTHELAQPLTVILSNAELAKSSLSRGGVSVEQQAELMDSILRNAKRGNAIVQSIRQRLQPVDPHLDRVDLISITAEVIELMVPLLEAHQVELVQRMQDTPLTVSGDSTELSQVVVILLTNAVEASAASAVRRIEITVQAKGERASLLVRDQGHGLSDEALTSAGDALFTTKPGGLGLGLEIAMTIVRQHYGTLMLANAPGGGAIAVVDLPQAVPANPFGA